MSNIPKVAVVILNWNGIKHLREFLPSVLSSVYPNLDIIVGDNASTDGSVEFNGRNIHLSRLFKTMITTALQAATTAYWLKLRLTTIFY